ncbi:NAD(P)/FAD-dependent oxidoreductase [Actinokineospora pegani]|uniref:NAD(P)/FAD-dependent oxidoreductase n=1 Tax=Actinokineospora pegani TaxID=2654637 RepID=UPI0012EAD2B2|nr:NAD(P)/FAD-dependent oxidoreductase [Actinokineospora pegani]
MNEDTLSPSYDVVVIGGGAAGLSGALMLARARRATAVIDAGHPRNAPAGGVHGLLGREGVPPLELAARGRAEARSYGAHIITGEVVTTTRNPTGDFTVTLADGRTTTARRLLITTGLEDVLPDIPGAAARWGKDLVHCPYCHGYEVRDQPLGVIATGPMSVHQALLFRQWTADLVLFTHDQPLPSEEDAEKLAARGVQVITGPIASLDTTDGRLTAITLADGRSIPRAAAAAATGMRARAGFIAGLDLALAPHPSGMGHYLPAEPTGKTTAPGVWAAGNVTDLSAQVGAAAAGAALAAAHLNGDLVTEETQAAVDAHRARATTAV